MKTIFPTLLIAVLMSSCIVETVEPRYDVRDRIVGYYEVEEFSETYGDHTYYDFRIARAGYDNEIYFHNFYGADLTVRAIVDHDRISIPFQVEDGYEIEGVGTIRGDELRLSYTVYDTYGNSRIDYCETIAWRE
jgi:hypothetical protein